MINTTVRIFKSSRGFTLIELVVVFSIIAVLSTLGIASFVTYSRSQTLNQATNDFITILNTAKAKSLSQDKPTICLNQVLNGYRVIIDDVNERYSLNVVCSGGTTIIGDYYTLPQGVTFETSPTTTPSVFFSVLTSGVVGSGDIIVSGFGKSHTVKVTSVGGIE